MQVRLPQDAEVDVFVGRWQVRRVGPDLGDKTRVADVIFMCKLEILQDSLKPERLCT